MSIKIRPLNDMVLVEPLKIRNVTPQGLYLPDSVVSSPADQVYAKVIRVGVGQRMESGERDPADVEKGDTVLYPAGAFCFPFEIGSLLHARSTGLPTLALVRGSDILGVVEEGASELMLEKPKLELVKT